MSGKLVLFTISIGFFLFVAPLVLSANAATLLFDPTTVSATVGQTFDVKVNANFGTEQIISIDAYVLYDTTLLDVVSVTKGTFFPTVSQNLTQTGKAYIGALVEDPAQAKTGTGTIATITFKPKSNGLVTLKYDCTQGSTTGTNINKKDNTNAVVCSGNGQSVVTISGATAGTATPTVAGTANPSKLPDSGTLTNIGAYGMMGLLLLFVGLSARFLI